MNVQMSVFVVSKIVTDKTSIKKPSEYQRADLSSGYNPSEKDETPCVHRTLRRFPIFIRIFGALSIIILAG